MLSIYMFMHTGLQHIGCYYVPRFSNFLSLLEGRTPDVLDNPLTRQNPVRKCGKAAQTLRFNLFGVSLGYCISGSNRITDYQYVRSALCADGNGGYSRGYYIMDVYEVVNVQSFSDSVQAVEAAVVGGTEPASLSPGSGDDMNGSPGFHHAGFLAILCGVLISVTLSAL